jgi:hypothetical protein
LWIISTVAHPFISKNCKHSERTIKLFSSLEIARRKWDFVRPHIQVIKIDQLILMVSSKLFYVKLMDCFPICPCSKLVLWSDSFGCHFLLKIHEKHPKNNQNFRNRTNRISNSIFTKTFLITYFGNKSNIEKGQNKLWIFFNVGILTKISKCFLMYFPLWIFEQLKRVVTWFFLFISINKF